MRRQHGFTLFEVLVALAIMAVALAALLRASGLAADNSENMRLRMLATWEAQNQIALIKARREWPEPGKLEGEAAGEGGPSLRWEREVAPTPNGDFRKVVIRILSPGVGHYVLAELTGYVERPRS